MVTGVMLAGLGGTVVSLKSFSSEEAPGRIGRKPISHKISISSAVVFGNGLDWRIDRL
jgi:hypothetical protein